MLKSFFSPQVHIPLRRNPKTFVFKMRCEVTSSKASNVLLSRELIVPTYKHVCRGEKKKVNLGYNNIRILQIVNNTLLHVPKQSYIFGVDPAMSYVWEVLSKFFSIHNIEPNWLDCGMSWGWFDKTKGEWTGCMGKV